MATIKSYTDINQSRKLAEILPLESADMYLWSSDKRYYIEAMDDGDFNEEEGHVRAWSLAALLSVLSDYTLQTNTDGTVFVVCESKKPMVSGSYENPVDACVAMIEKLNELNLL